MSDRPAAAAWRTGPWWALALVAALAAWAYVDVKLELAELRGRLAGQGLLVTAGPAPPEARPGQRAPEEPAPGQPAPGQPAQAVRAAPVRPPAPGAPRPPWACEGTLTRAEAAVLTARYGPEAFGCYRERLAEVEGFGGEYLLFLRVGPGGAVEAVSSQGAAAEDTALRTCVEERARSWVLAEPSGGECATVYAPFLFEPPDPNRGG